MSPTATIQLELPEDLLAAAKISEHDAPREITRLAAFEMYREGRISLQKACELAGIDLWEFLEFNKTLGIPLNYDVEEWRRDHDIVEKLAK